MTIHLSNHLKLIINNTVLQIDKRTTLAKASDDKLISANNRRDCLHEFEY